LLPQAAVSARWLIPAVYRVPSQAIVKSAGKRRRHILRGEGKGTGKRLSGLARIGTSQQCDHRIKARLRASAIAKTIQHRA